MIKGVYQALEAACKNPPMDDVVLYVDCHLCGDVELIENMHTDCLFRCVVHIPGLVRQVEIQQRLYLVFLLRVHYMMWCILCNDSDSISVSICSNRLQC
jgi:hypothetical protein